MKQLSVDKVHYFFDESGEKGFLNGDFDPASFGLVAGIALPSRNVETFEANLDTLFSSLDMTGVGKAHATEIFQDGKNAQVREDLFEVMLCSDELMIIYEALYPLGVFKRERATEELLFSPVPENSKVKVSRNHKRNRLYTMLLEGVILKLDEMCQIEESSEVVMLSDQIDYGLLKEAMQELEYLKQEEHVQRVSGFDVEKQAVVYGLITSRVEGFSTAVKYVKSIEVDTAATSLTLAADIVANTLYYHLTEKISQDEFPRLHSPATLEGFPLKEKVAFQDEDCFVDTMFSPCPEPNADGD